MIIFVFLLIRVRRQFISHNLSKSVKRLFRTKGETSDTECNFQMNFIIKTGTLYNVSRKKLKLITLSLLSYSILKSL